MSKIGKLILGSIVATSFLLATNGDTLIGVGAKTRSMGGAGIAFSHGAESTLVNPALITSVDSTGISVGGTIFLPDIHTELGANTPSGKRVDSADSDADISLIPTVATVNRLDNGIYLGAGMYGTAGMGTDFRDKGKSSWMLGNDKLFDMETTLQLMQFALPIAYKVGGLSLAIAPIIQYGSLDIHYKMVGANGKPGVVSPGQRQDFGLGANIGATYDFGNGFSVGAMYKSEIKMNYGNTLKDAASPFGISLNGHLDQPSEYGLGIGYKNGPHAIALDWKRIEWSKSAGYSDFGWDNQDVFAIGYQYDAGSWSLRVGYNYAKMPITIYNSSNRILASKDMFNLLGFPATSEKHITFGGTYLLNDKLSIDLTVVYALNEKNSADVGGAFGMPARAVNIYNEHKELGFTIQMNYKF